MEEFRPNSIKFNKKLDKEERQEQGIYFTPKKIRQRLFEIVKQFLLNEPKTILEPSFGSGEFLCDSKMNFPKAKIYGVELQEELYNSVHLPGVNLYNQDFLLYKGEPVELVIGNPPYFVTEQKDPRCMVGRGNIFVQFIYKSVTEHLSENGILAFILPTSFYNSSYYEPCRKYIYDNLTILHLENLDGGFYDTSQDTSLMVLQNKKTDQKDYSIVLNSKIYFTPFYKELNEILKDSTTIDNLECKVKTGEVVWNQNKDLLDDVKGDLIIYSSNIIKNKLILDIPMKNGKKQRIKDFPQQTQKGPAIVVNRGYGNTFSLNYAFVPEGQEFHGENHVNVITPLTPEAKKNIPRILKSFDNPKTARFISIFCGNGALSKTELESILPIF
jgi:adenine-specific DNA-methyltransferase